MKIRIDPTLRDMIDSPDLWYMAGNNLGKTFDVLSEVPAMGTQTSLGKAYLVRHPDTGAMAGVWACHADVVEEEERDCDTCMYEERDFTEKPCCDCSTFWTPKEHSFWTPKDEAHDCTTCIHPTPNQYNERCEECGGHPDYPLWQGEDDITDCDTEDDGGGEWDEKDVYLEALRNLSPQSVAVRDVLIKKLLSTGAGCEDIAEFLPTNNEDDETLPEFYVGPANMYAVAAPTEWECLRRIIELYDKGEIQDHMDTEYGIKFRHCTDEMDSPVWEAQFYAGLE